jgi:hypothetical protein
VVSVVIVSMRKWVLHTCRNPSRGCLVHNRLPRDLVALQVFVVLECVVLVSDTVERRTLAFLETSVLLSFTLEVTEHSTEIELAEDAVVRDPVVALARLPVVRVLERSHVRGADPHWHERIAVINSVDFLTVQVPENVVFDNWVLRHRRMVSSGVLSTDAVSKSEDVLILVVLKSVLVHIN